MRAVIQRVKKARVQTEGGDSEQIEHGLVVLLGIEKEDKENDSQYLAEKISNLRLFPNEEKEFEKTVVEINGEILVISQFTLYADCRKGRRPDFTQAARAEKAKFLYETFVEKLKKNGLKIKTGKFGAKMLVEIHNDGPVTIILDTDKVIGLAPHLCSE